MTRTDDPRFVEAMWRAADLTRAYLAQDSAHVAACLTGLDTDQQEHFLMWLVLEHDALFGDLGEPTMGVRRLNELAALAPPETELATTTAFRRIAAEEVGLTRAVEDLELRDRVHTIAICTAVMLLEALGPIHALKHLDNETAEYERKGYPRPPTLP
ncbi:hypothetical protein DVA86_32390 [Streptomyces armeniacus]|uniref:Uncharacterized protein n=1 Tax=Streptomyces armeniacus TaxID=83291 RepID=A0A345XY62_9ACTN|nr:hypothetical protein [Streptomyces armeniacus]AXK36578.1 hypothetical protein DVA86_32390 [Streptomyces armeniacus]